MPLEKPEKSFSPDRPRSELLKHFTENVFGKRPVERPPELKFERIAPDEEILGGLGIKRRMKFVYGNGRGKSGEARFTAYIPRKKGRHPSFLLIAPHDPDTIGERVSAKRAARMPVKELLLRGFAGISYKNDDCAADYVAVSPVKYDYTPGYAMTNGVWDVFGPTGAERTETSWGAISAWAWGASRVMDWIETQPELDAGRVAVVGLSRCGKTALWAGASDTRFALTVSCCSGCGGAKMNRLDLPHSEHIANLAEVFPHWFSKAFYRYSGRDAEVPVDMDGLIALCAPRRVLVCSASEDTWAGPYGEYMSAKLASSAWERYGLKGLVGEFPPPGKPLQDGRIAYHVRPGPHLQTIYDWNRCMDFFTPDETLSARD